MKYLLIIFICLCYWKAISQTETDKQFYEKAFLQISDMLESEKQISFKDVVFITENAFHNNAMEYEDYSTIIKEKVDIAELWLAANHLENYIFKDSLEFAKNGAIFKLMTDTIFLLKGIPISYPYSYDFDDFFGEKDWSKMFVTKLLETGTGNCHSMPYLYKILSDEIGTKAYLSFAPNHLYIKQKSQKHGWYNTELTSAAFPIDAWIMTSGYISREAIISGIYMDTLNDKQLTSLCLIDLAHGYMHKFKYGNEDFVLKCCDLALINYPNYINALLLKAKILNSKFEKTNEQADRKQLLIQLEATLQDIVKTGYREIPEKVYFEWLSDLANNKEKYQNKKLLKNF